MRHARTPVRARLLFLLTGLAGLVPTLPASVQPPPAALSFAERDALQHRWLRQRFDTILPALFSDFRSLLRSGGRVALADQDREDGSFHSPEITDVHHLGFERLEIRGLLAAAGFDDLEDATAFVHRRDDCDYPVFLITGRVRAASHRCDGGVSRPGTHLVR